jgi:hypothetical protein
MPRNADKPMLTLNSITLMLGFILTLFAVTRLIDRHQIPASEVEDMATFVVTLADQRIPGNQTYQIAYNYQASVDNTMADPTNQISIRSNNPTLCSQLPRAILTNDNTLSGKNPFTAVRIGTTRLSAGEAMNQTRIQALCLPIVAEGRQAVLTFSYSG